MRTTSPKEVEAVLALDGPARFKHFIKRVVDDESVWSLWSDGWGLMETNEDQRVFPLWPAREYALLCRTGDFANYTPEKISLDDLVNDLLPKVAEKHVLPAIFPTPTGKGVILSVSELASALAKESEQYP